MESITVKKEENLAKLDSGLDKTPNVMVGEAKTKTKQFGKDDCEARDIVDSRIDIWSTPDVNKKCTYGVLQMSTYN